MINMDVVYMDMEMHTIHLQSQLDTLLQKFDWTDAFVREAFVLSPSYVTEDEGGIVAYHIPATVRILVSFPDKAHPGLELYLHEVDSLFLDFQLDLEPTGVVNEIDGSIRMHLYGNEQAYFQARSLRYRVLDESSWGWKVRYGIYNLFDEGGVPLDIPE